MAKDFGENDPNITADMVSRPFGGVGVNHVDADFSIGTVVDNLQMYSGSAIIAMVPVIRPILCTGSGPPLRYYDPGSNAGFGSFPALVIFPSMPVNCDGEIVKWKYYAHTSGSMMVGI